MRYKGYWACVAGGVWVGGGVGGSISREVMKTKAQAIRLALQAKHGKVGPPMFLTLMLCGHYTICTCFDIEIK